MDKKKGIKNILAVYQMATEEEKAQGLAWYPNARRFCRRMAKKYGVSMQIAIAVLAALSPRNKWERNLLDVEKCLEAYLYEIGSEHITVSTFPANKEKAFRIIRENNPLLVQTSNKVAAFFDNIYRLHSSSEVCVDIHAFSIFMGFRAEQSTLTDTHYQTIADAYRLAAKRVGLKPFEIQAITWVAWRRLTSKHKVRKVTPAQYKDQERFAA